MEWLAVLRWLHIVGASVLLGTGAGIAFFMVMAVRTRDPYLITHTASIVVLADLIFTASAVIVQPIAGILLAKSIGWPLSHGWVAWSIGLYILTGLFWLPVVWIQYRLRAIANECAKTGTPLTEEFTKLYRIWFFCGFPAFFSVLAIVWLMISKPIM